jgi:hypothetical protein
MKKSARKRIMARLIDPNRAFDPLWSAMIATPLIKVRGEKSKILKGQVYQDLIALNNRRITKVLQTIRKKGKPE